MTLTATRDELDRNDERATAIRRRIDRTVALTRLTLLWEDLWPRLVPLFAVVGVFALASWFGLWPGLPEWARLGLLAAFAAAAIAALVPVAGLRMPGHAVAFARAERASGLPNRPATSFFDRRAGSLSSDTRTEAIWLAHRERLLAGFGRMAPPLPSPGLARRDPYGFRFLLLLLLAIAFIAAGGGWLDRMADAFRSGASASAAAIPIRIDAWAEPPAYTGRPSVFLTGTAVRTEGELITVPEGTQVFIRIAGAEADAAQLVTGGPIAEAPRVGDGPREFQVTLERSGAVEIAAAGRTAAAWSFQVIPDLAPEIALLAAPERAAAGGLQVGYAISDDYGVVAAWGEMVRAGAEDGARPLVGAPDYRLTVPRTAAGEAVTVRDLSSHPWAGLEVLLTLVAEDAAGQRGTVEAGPVVIPARVFVNPVANALIAARQMLALDANRADEVAVTIDALAGADLPGIGAFLALRSAFFRLVLADTDDDLRGVIDYLWEIAVGLENNALADTAAGLQEAADALREALERGADPAEIELLADALRNAMGLYLQALTDNVQPFETRPAVQVDTRILRPGEFEAMLDELEEAVGRGEIATAEQLLNEFERLMQNLEPAPVTDMEREFQPPVDALDDLGFVMQQQQRLMDETFALRQQLAEPLLPLPRTEEEREQYAEALGERREADAAEAERLAAGQRQVHAALLGLLEQFLGQGDAALALEEAEQAMMRAAERLADIRPDMAIPEQAEALEQMQAFAEELARMLAEAAELPMDVEGAQDPVGRPPPLEGPRYGDDVAVPEVIDRQLAREILEAIRQRLEERDRPPGELDYLERLIEPF